MNLHENLYAVATCIGIDSNNPDGGLHHDSSDEVILETVIDIARGCPYDLPISQDDLTDNQREAVVRAFFDGVHYRQGAQQ